MRIKKNVIVCLLCALTAASLISPASAHGCGRHGGHHGRNTTQTAVTVCPMEDCAAAGRHTHSGTVCCGYGHENGFCGGSCAAV